MVTVDRDRFVALVLRITQDRGQLNIHERQLALSGKGIPRRSIGVGPGTNAEMARGLLGERPGQRDCSHTGLEEGVSLARAKDKRRSVPLEPSKKHGHK